MDTLGPFAILTPAKPVHRDDAIEMIKFCPAPICLDKDAEAEMALQSANWYDELRENPYNILHHCQWFDFGKVSPTTIKEAASTKKISTNFCTATR